MNKQKSFFLARHKILLIIFLTATQFQAAFSQTNELCEAESAKLLGTAQTVNCNAASGGKMVKGLDQGKSNALLFENIDLPEAGNYFITISYFSTADRAFSYVLNDGVSQAKEIPASGQWCYQGGIPADFTFQGNFVQGNNKLLIHDAPIIDKIVISSDSGERERATFYISSVTGNDSNNGFSPSSAWQSINKVNALKLMPGDSILFKSGETFTGQLSILNEGGQTGNPVTIGNYGSGNLPILDGDGYLSTIQIVNSGGIHLSNIEIINNGGPAKPGEPENLRYGIYFENTTTNGTVYQHYRLRNITFKNIYPTIDVDDDDQTGINAYAIATSGNWSANIHPTQFRDMVIEGCYFTRTARHATVFKATDSLEIRNNLFEHVGGAGMVIGNNCSNILVEHNTTNYTGSSIDSRMAGRGSGIWCFRSTNLTVQHNRFMHARGFNDSYGMHIDIGNRNVVYQYNYSEDNEGGFVEVLGGNMNVGYRYNVSIGDGWRTRGSKHGKVFWISGWSGDPEKPIGSDSVFVYNNSIYVSDSIVPEILIVAVTKNTRIYNNIIYVANGFGAVRIQNDPVLNDFNNNIWFGNIPVLDENGESYRGTGALTADPLFNQKIVTDSAGFILQAKSPALKTGKLIYDAEISGSFDYFHNHGGRDYFGNKVHNSGKPNIGAYNGQGLTTSSLRMDMPGKNMGLYPNPANNTIYFKGIDEPVLLSILSSEGRLIKQPKVETSLDISDLRSGFYILKSMGYRPSVLIKTE
jgi:hypothetical protein